MNMQKVKRAADWIRKNAGVLALMLMFIGGITATVRYFLTLATEEDVTAAVRDQTASLAGLPDTVTELQETVMNLDRTVVRLEAAAETMNVLSSTVTALAEMVNTLSGSLERLEGSFEDLEGAFEGLEGTFEEMDTKYSDLASCVIELHGPWNEGADAPSFRLPDASGPSQLPTSCESARRSVNPQVASGR